VHMATEASKRKPVCCERPHEGIAVLTIDRPERRNALSLEVKGLLTEQLNALIADDAVRVMVLTGAGGVFVAGTDIAEMANMSPVDHERLQTGHVFTVLRQCPKPVIAAVEGYALGGGCELALCCDMIIAAEGARFGQPEIRVGIMPGAGATQRLLRTAGKYRTMKMVLTGEPVSAAEALSMGFVSEVVDDGQTLTRAIALAQTILGMPPLAVKAIKEVIQAGQESPLDAALQIERKAFQLLFGTQDQKEGMNAFLEKRRPNYKGR
jgi:enoyl-CoA hydratase